MKNQPLGTREHQGAWRKLLGRRAQTFVEFALVAPVFLMLLYGAMSLSLAVYTYNYVSFAAREGSRYAAVHGTDSASPVTTASAVSTYVQNETVGLNINNLTVSTTWAPSATPGKPGGTVQVQVQYQYQVSVPFMTTVTLPMTSTSTMTIS